MSSSSRKFVGSVKLLAAFVVGLSVIERQAYGAEIIVPATVSSQTELAAYIDEARDGDVVQLPAGPIQFACTKNEDNSIHINHSITIEGPKGGCEFVGVKTGNGANFLTTEEGTSVTLRNITFHDTYLPDKPIALVHAKGRIALDGCSFRNVQLSAPGSISATLVTEDDAAVTNCTFACMTQSMGNVNYGGAWCAKGGTVDVYGSVFTNCFCSSGGGAVALLADVTGARFENTKFLDCYTNNGGGKGGAILDLMSSSSAGLDVISCIFRHCRGKASVVYCADGAGAHRLFFERCEFTDCFSKSWGTLLKSGNGNPTIFLFSTFANFVGSQWGAGMDIRAYPLYMVNCTMVGGINTSNLSDAGGGLNTFSDAKILNSVLAYNYHDLGNQNIDLAVYGGTSTLINSIANSPKKAKYESGSTPYTLAESLQDVPSATKLFGAYEEISSFDGSHTPYKGSFTDDQVVIDLSRTVVVPTLDKPRGAMKMLSVAPRQGGLLCKTGFPVKANPSRTYLAYSADGGTTWTTLYGTDPGDGSVSVITTDQLGNTFAKPPIGAVAPITGGLSIGIN